MGFREETDTPVDNWNGQQHIWLSQMGHITGM